MEALLGRGALLLARLPSNRRRSELIWAFETWFWFSATRAGLPLELRRSRQFRIDLPEFREWAEGRKGLRLEHFYRYTRRRMGVLMQGKDPEGGTWNFDKENRKTFGR